MTHSAAQRFFAQLDAIKVFRFLLLGGDYY